MNRNVESHFAELPKLEIGRSTFDRSSSHKTSFDVGSLIPFYLEEVIPGDTFKVTTSAVVRLQTLLTPIMDNVYMDTYYFFVPNRIVWQHWPEFMGENKESAWYPQTEYVVPRILPPADGWNVGTIADYMGIPTGIGSSGGGTIVAPISLPFRGYAMICDTWFRDQNVTDPLNITLSDANSTGSNGTNYITDTELGGAPFKVAKYHDYFSSALPAPQKGPEVGIVNTVTPVNQQIKGPAWAPVYARNGEYVTFDTAHTKAQLTYNQNYSPDAHIAIKAKTPFTGTDPNTVFTNATTGVYNLIPENLWADISQSNITINDLRLAFQLQKYFEKNARSGTRYRELIKAHFGVQVPDARMMIPEYLGGHRFPLSIHQVANQSQGENQFLGDLGAMSNTSDIHEDFVKSFTEHGFVIGVCCVRYDHSYPQGLERFWTRNRKLSYYFPVFANLGEQEVKKHELYWQKNEVYEGNTVFGYQEAWAEYRYKPSRVSGEMRPGIANSLANWHLSDYYTDVPSLSDSWIREDKANVDRVLAVQSSVSNQVFADFYVKNIATRPMPMYSIPGLIDHH